MKARHVYCEEINITDSINRNKQGNDTSNHIT